MTAHDVPARGYSPLYDGPATRCPSCHRTHWYVGRISAQCAFCATALPLAPDRRAA